MWRKYSMKDKVRVRVGNPTRNELREIPSSV